MTLPLLPSLPCRRHLLSPSELLDARSAPSKKPPFHILPLSLHLSLPFPHFRPPLPLPTHSFPLSTASTRHPTQPHHAGSSATIPPMLSTILSPFKLIPGFRPLFSGLFISLAYKTLHPVCNTQMHDFAINGRQFVCQLKDARVLACDSSKHDRQWRSPPCTTWRRVTRKM